MSNPAKQRLLQFWLELASPYTYLAAERIERLAADAHVDIEWKPFLLGPVLKGLGARPPVQAQPWKKRYLIRDLKRLAEKYGIPFARETGDPVFSLLASRVALVGLDHGWGVAFIKSVFRANFADCLDIADKKVIGRILDSLGQPVDEVLAMAVSTEIKSRLREQTDTASRLGIFGSPTFIVNGEMFWGQDRLRDAIAWASAA